jgi:hypothetical protein
VRHIIKGEGEKRGAVWRARRERTKERKKRKLIREILRKGKEKEMVKT